MGGDVDRQ